MIGGNVPATIQAKTSIKNAFGELITTWEDVVTVNGFLDFLSGDSSHKSTYKGKLEETTHIFICDFNATVSSMTPTLSRMLVGDKTYDVLMIDNPMGLNRHLEIMLKYVEAVN